MRPEGEVGEVGSRGSRGLHERLHHGRSTSAGRRVGLFVAGPPSRPPFELLPTSIPPTAVDVVTHPPLRPGAPSLAKTPARPSDQLERWRSICANPVTCVNGGLGPGHRRLLERPGRRFESRCQPSTSRQRYASCPGVRKFRNASTDSTGNRCTNTPEPSDAPFRRRATHSSGHGCLFVRCSTRPGGGEPEGGSPPTSCSISLNVSCTRSGESRSRCSRSGSYLPTTKRVARGRDPCYPPHTSPSRISERTGCRRPERATGSPLTGAPTEGRPPVDTSD